MPALTHQKYELRGECLQLIMAHYDSMGPAEQRRFMEATARNLAGRLTVADLKDWRDRMAESQKGEE